METKNQEEGNFVGILCELTAARIGDRDGTAEGWATRMNKSPRRVSVEGREESEKGLAIVAGAELIAVFGGDIG